LAFFFLDERITYLQVFGMFVVIAGVTLVSKRK
jgi:drug/metabolite transporter (DMT)-like permease